MKNVILYTVMTVLFLACNGNSGYEIKGVVVEPSLEGQYVYLSEYNQMGTTVFRDSALIKNGAFSMKGTQKSPKLYQLSLSPEMMFVGQDDQAWVVGNSPYLAVFVLEHGKIEVKLDLRPIVTGTPENDILTDFQMQILPFEKSLNAIVSEYSANRDDQEAVKGLEQAYYEVVGELALIVKNHLSHNLDRFSSGKILYDFRFELPEEEQRAVLAKASPLLKTAPGIDYLIGALAVSEKNSIGMPFTDMEMLAPDGSVVKLSDYAGKGKYVLIDFWASWCVPCRQEMPYLIDAYKNYKDKGFEIIGVSFDDSQAAWERGIKDLGLLWPQMSDLKGWESIGSSTYGVRSIPYTVLLDREGVIIAKNIRGEAISEQLKELLQ